MRALVVMPTYNEVDSMGRLVTGVLAQSPDLELMVVDDGSPDGTAAAVRELQTREPRLHLLARPAKLGLGSAYLAGFRQALDRGFDAIFTMDGDGSHEPGFFPAMLEALRSHDMVIGSRYVPGGGISNWPIHRRLLSLCANTYTRLLLRLPQHDCTSGFRAYRREVLERVRPFEVRASGYSFLYEMVWRVHRAGFRIAEVPIQFVDRTQGTSKIDQSEIFRAIWHVFALAPRPFRARPREGDVRGDHPSRSAQARSRPS